MSAKGNNPSAGQPADMLVMLGNHVQPLQHSLPMEPLAITMQLQSLYEAAAAKRH
jgi:hypothetical protein